MNKKFTKEEQEALIPSRFWKHITAEGFRGIYENNGCLNAELCARLWRIEDRQSEPPQSLEVLIHRPTFERLLRAEKNKKRAK
jgi:hypothetical protein